MKRKTNYYKFIGADKFKYANNPWLGHNTLFSILIYRSESTYQLQLQTSDQAIQN